MTQDLQHSHFLQTLVGIGVVLLALGLGLGAISIPSKAGYAGIGPNFLPWLVAAALLLCGVFMIREARSGGFRDMEEGSGEGTPYWSGFVWMSAGLLANAALITTIGFIFSCALCFVLAARGLRNAERQSLSGLKPWLSDVITGLLIAAPVYWMFTQFLAINLPGLTQSGWL
jgi:putative tricarboxylic transport membrane protein